MVALVGMCLFANAGAFSEDAFHLGPEPARVDLRNMLREHIVRQSCQMLNQIAEKRETAFDKNDWQAWRDAVRHDVATALGEMNFGPLNIRNVSRHERSGYVIDNVLFESLPGWDVNASVYLPDAAAFPPPWPAIVVPVGHSGKQFESYQKPAQVFAKLGFVAVTFDPPNMAGEKRDGNDHFRDGIRCNLTGQSSNRYFVADAVRCIDYLETRPDVDMRSGVGMTGVSGGGFTTMFATLLDDRIKASGPSCTAVPNAYHPVLDCYAPCPETLAPGRFGQYDDVDVLAAALPTPLLLMAGAQDEVFKGEWSDQIATTVSRCFDKAGLVNHFAYFSDPGGHAYTIAMALEFAKWMDRWVCNRTREMPKWAEADCEMVPDDLLKCSPRLEGNMFSINAALAVELRAHRSGMSVSEAIRKIANVSSNISAPDSSGREPFLVWFHQVEEVLLQPEAGIELPVTFAYPAKKDWRGAAVLYFDDRGRWTDLRQQGFLADLSGFLNKDTDGPAILTVDLRGWGDSKPADAPYDIAGWADRERWVSYVSAGMGDPILGMRIRDGLAALAWLRSRREVDPERIVVGGRGMGGVVALHLAALEKTAGVFTMDGLATFESLATSASYAWSPEDFMSGVLLHYDLPELVAALDVPVLVANPLDAEKQPLDDTAAEKTYSLAVRPTVHPKLDTSACRKAVREFVGQVIGK